MNTFNNRLYADIVCDPTFRKTAELLVTKSGIRSDLKGFILLVDAVILYGTKSCESFNDIYTIIGDLRDLKTKSVMREMTYCLSQSVGAEEHLSKLLGITVKSTDFHVGLVVSCLAELFKKPKASLYD